MPYTLLVDFLPRLVAKVKPNSNAAIDPMRTTTSGIDMPLTECHPAALYATVRAPNGDAALTRLGSKPKDEAISLVAKNGRIPRTTHEKPMMDIPKIMIFGDSLAFWASSERGFERKEMPNSFTNVARASPKVSANAMLAKLMETCSTTLGTL